MYAKFFLNLAFILLLTVIEFSFISGLPLGLANFNLVLVILVFILMVGGLEYALWWAFGAGLMLDIFSFGAFGIYMASLILAVLALNFLVVNFFTNRSLYSFLATAFLGTVIYEIIFNLIGYVISVSGGRDSSLLLGKIFWQNKLSEIIFNIIGTLIVFYILNSLSNRLKPVFINKYGFSKIQNQ